MRTLKCEAFPRRVRSAHIGRRNACLTNGMTRRRVTLGKSIRSTFDNASDKSPTGNPIGDAIGFFLMGIWWWITGIPEPKSHPHLGNRTSAARSAFGCDSGVVCGHWGVRLGYRVARPNATRGRSCRSRNWWLTSWPRSESARDADDPCISAAQN